MLWNIFIQGFKMCVYVLLFFLFDKVILYVKIGFCCEIVRFKLLIFFGYDQVIDVFI